MNDDRFNDFEEELRPINAAPWLFTFNTIGFGLFGKRDFRQEDHTYVTNHVICMLFMPVLFLGAYRVYREGNQYAFLGRLPLGSLTKLWNISLVVTVSAVSFFAYQEAAKNQPPVIAQEMLTDIVKGQDQSTAYLLLEYLNLRDYAEVHRLKAIKAEAVFQLKSLAEKSPLSSEPMEAVQLYLKLNRLKSELKLTDWPERGRQMVALYRQDAPQAAYELCLNLSQEKSGDEFADLASVVLNEWLEQQPDNTKALGYWAMRAESDLDPAVVIAKLEPVKQSLGSGEAARVLSIAYLAKGQNQQALPLVESYVNPRIKQLEQLNKKLTPLTNQLYDAALSDLQNNRAPQRFYTRYEKASEAKQNEMVSNYIWDQIEGDPKYKRLMEQIEPLRPAVSMALDLGILKLEQAKAMAEPSQREAAMLEIEEIFKGIQGLAGDSGDYQFTMGQVYYWLGKEKEGKQQFDQLLVQNARDPELLLSVAYTLREVGATKDARAHAEEAFNKSANNAEMRYRAAGLVALIVDEPEDKLKWLEKTGKKDAHTQANIRYAKAQLTLREGKEAEAIEHFKAYLAYLNQQPKDLTTLNNRAMTHLALFYAGNGYADFEKTCELQIEAIQQGGASGIVFYNTSDLFRIKAGLDFFQQKAKISNELLRYIDLNDRTLFVSTPQEKQAVDAEITALESFSTFEAMNSKAALLSHKNARVHASQAVISEIKGDYGDRLRFLEELDRINLDYSADQATWEMTLAKGNLLDAAIIKGKIADFKQCYEAAQQHGSTLEQALYLKLWRRSLRDLNETDSPQSAKPLALAVDQLRQQRECRFSQDLQIQSWFMVLSQEWAEKNPAYAAFEQQVRHVFNQRRSLLLALEMHPEWRESLVELPSYSKLRQLVEANWLKWQEPDLEMWKILQASDSPQGQQMAAAFKQEGMHQTVLPMTTKLWPHTGSTHLSKVLFADFMENQEAFNQDLGLLSDQLGFKKM